MTTYSGNRFTTAPLARLPFFLMFALAAVVFAAIAVLLGLNYGLRNVLYLFLPVAAVFLLIVFSLVARRFTDAGLPGIAVAAASLAILAVLFGTGQYAWGTVATAVLFVVGCVLPARRAG
jgi:uncharacterized membrane protein YhaH (DUF805 family)